jgi:hypothetical protein
MNSSRYDFITMRPTHARSVLGFVLDLSFREPQHPPQPQHSLARVLHLLRLFR